MTCLQDGLQNHIGEQQVDLLIDVQPGGGDLLDAAVEDQAAVCEVGQQQPRAPPLRAAGPEVSQ